MKVILVFSFLFVLLNSELIRIPLQYQQQNIAKTIITHRKIQKYFPMQRLPLFNYKMAQYIGKVKIGSRLREFKMIFDTGSSLTWLPAKDCSSCRNSGLFHYFHCTSSKTCTKLNRKITLKYGAGSVTTELLKDTIKIGNINVKNQYFGQAILVKDLPKIKADGILALGFSENHSKTIIDNMKDLKLLKKRIFSFYLKSKNHASDKNFQNQFTLGDYDPKFIKKGQSLVYCKVIKSNNPKWVVDLNSISLSIHGLKKKKSISFSTHSKKALIDSGTSLIAVSSKTQNEFLKVLKKQKKNCSLYKGFIICDDKKLANYPDIVFNLCGHNVILNPIDYIEKHGKNVLIGTQIYQGIGEDDDFVILGYTFLRKYYTVFNLDAKKIGFALASTKNKNQK